MGYIILYKNMGLIMKIDLISDIHLEAAPFELTGGDILILSGDICESRKLVRDCSENRTEKTDFRYINFFKNECAKYRHVIYVIGNHEHYGTRFDKTHDEIKECLPSNVTLLNRESIEIDGVVFIGGTMWTNFHKGSPISMDVALRNMNDFRAIKYWDRRHDKYYKLTPQVVYREHMDTIYDFGEMLKANAHKPCVVVSHHAPTYLSIAEEYKNDHLLNGAYASDLSEFILDHPQIKVWTHGHTHTRFKYEMGDTTVVCNPRGYSGIEAISRNYKPRGFEIDQSGNVIFDDDWN